jgi:Sulfate permease family
VTNLPSGYQKDWLRLDAVAGLATAAVVIPKSMAYASIAGLPVQAVEPVSRSLRSISNGPKSNVPRPVAIVSFPGAGYLFYKGSPAWSFEVYASVSS